MLVRRMNVVNRRTKRRTKALSQDVKYKNSIECKLETGARDDERVIETPRDAPLPRKMIGFSTGWEITIRNQLT